MHRYGGSSLVRLRPLAVGFRAIPIERFVIVQRIGSDEQKLSTTVLGSWTSQRRSREVCLKTKTKTLHSVGESRVPCMRKKSRHALQLNGIGVVL